MSEDYFSRGHIMDGNGGTSGPNNRWVLPLSRRLGLSTEYNSSSWEHGFVMEDQNGASSCQT